jgi:hypothetical protein
MERTSGTVVAAALCEDRMIRPYCNTYTPYNPYLNHWTGPDPLRILLRPPRSKNTDSIM